jgi:hypothetical protein
VFFTRNPSKLSLHFSGFSTIFYAFLLGSANRHSLFNNQTVKRSLERFGPS